MTDKVTNWYSKLKTKGIETTVDKRIPASNAFTVTPVSFF